MVSAIVVVQVVQTVLLVWAVRSKKHFGGEDSR